jgi:hypothetical protein
MRLFCFIPVILSVRIFGQPYPPPAGQAGSSAVSKDSSVFTSWASFCQVFRGPQDISNPNQGIASAGDSSFANGKADGITVSLGDGGSALCFFNPPIVNGSGDDFAVFENSFDGLFLELAFVEVSSDGIHFFRFPTRSLSDTTVQTASFGTSDATRINNLAGKYRVGFGTPFDLSELSGEAGLDLNHVSHVRIVDVVGAMDNQFATRDGHGSKINDPWPTPFPSGGFDLDAIGIIHGMPVGMTERENEKFFFVNPARPGVKLFSGDKLINMCIRDLQGRVVLTATGIIPEHITPGLYLAEFDMNGSKRVEKMIILSPN